MMLHSAPRAWTAQGPQAAPEVLRAALAASAQGSGGRAAAGERPAAGQLGQRLGGLGAALAAARLARRERRGEKVRRRDAAGDKSSSALRKAMWEAERQVPALRRFLVEDVSLGVDFASMEPLEDDPKVHDFSSSRSPLYKLQSMKQHGGIRQMVFTVNKVSDMHLVLCACNVDAGMVCGLGMSTSVKRAKQLAALQVMERLSFPKDPATELGTSEREGAQLAKETFECLSERHFSNTSMCVMQPVGTSWKVFLQTEFQGYRIIGLSPLAESREEAIAFAAQQFYDQLRARLRIPRDELHAPEEWAEVLDYEEVKQTLDLGRLGKKGVQETLASALEEGEDGEKLDEALQEALARQEARQAEAISLTYREDEEDGFEPGVVARRCYEVTKPEDEEWRRDEVKGKLPAERIRGDISKALEYGQVVVVSGGTGSGKSTQLPQFLLDDFREWKVERADGGEGEQPLPLEVDAVVEVEYEDVWYPCTILEVADDKSTITAKYHEGGDEEGDIDVAERVRRSKPRWARQVPRIVVTQPRRIAAVSLAERVAWERFGEVGGEIGHSIRGDTILPNSETGTVEFCTVGTLLRRVIIDPMLSRYNIVVLDEVHERDLMTDYVLVLIREVLEKRPDLRLVVMSATLDVQTFVNFLPGCEVVEVPTGTRYSVEETHLDDPYFADFVQTKGLLMNEQESRRSGGAAQGMHEFGTESAALEAKQARSNLEKQIQMAIDDDEDAAKEWEVFCDRMLDGERDLTKHPASMLRKFLAQADGGDGDLDEEAEPPSAVLAEQIEQLRSYSDEFREAWNGYCENREGGERPAEWESRELLDFLKAQGVRPWNVERASWELTSSSSWWGSQTNDSTFVSLAEGVINNVVPEMLEAPVDDEFGTGAILCFLPGWAEIKRLAELLEDSPQARTMLVLRLHSTVDKLEQQRVFEAAPEGMVKVILATNIAESSVTINDVRVVIDSGLHREVTYDPKRRMSSMETVWICQSNAVQRKGRAGRVREGRVFRLYSREQFESVPWRPAPEMQRCNLAQTCLQTISLGRDPRDFLAKAPDPPMVANLEAAMAELTSIEAIKDGSPPMMLPVGQVLSRMPLEPLMGRAMMLGTLFGIPQMTSALLIAGRGDTAFINPPDMREEAKTNKKEFCEWSDSMAELRALVEFEHVYKERGEAAASAWAHHSFLNAARLMTWSRMRFQLLQDVQRSGLLDASATDGLDPEEWLQAEEGSAFWESDSAGAIVDASERTRGLGRQEWMEELSASSREVEDERLLVGILCFSMPTNFAVRQLRVHKKHLTRVGTQAVIHMRSVNSAMKKTDETPEWVTEPSWWLYSDVRLFMSQYAMSDTTFISNWNLALFGGLRFVEEPSLMLDSWIGIGGKDEVVQLVKRLRKEIRQSLAWVAIAASWDRVALAAVNRSKALLRVLGRIILGEEPEEEDVKYIREWRLPQLEEGEATLQAEEVQPREEVERVLFAKTVVELKVMLREMGAKVSGRKAVLVQRCADFLMYGEEVVHEEGGWGEE